MDIDTIGACARVCDGKSRRSNAHTYPHWNTHSVGLQCVGLYSSHSVSLAISVFVMLPGFCGQNRGTVLRVCVTPRHGTMEMK